MLDIVLVVVALILAIVVYLLFKLHRLSSFVEHKLNDIEKPRARDLRQIQGLINVYYAIKPTAALPAFHDHWSILPDFAEVLIQEVLARKPKLIVDIGSGLSSLIMGYCLQRIGEGKVLALDHDEKYAARTKKMIRLHGLTDYVEVLHQPLVETTVDIFRGKWYDVDFLNGLNQKIDILTVDAPPGYIQKHSRYPALPLLYKYLNREVVVIVDDTKREDESSIVSLWTSKYQDFDSKTITTEAGATMLIRSNTYDS